MEIESSGFLEGQGVKQLSILCKCAAVSHSRPITSVICITGVDTIQAAKKEAKERKRRQGTAVVGDMKPLEDTLPTLELLLRDTSSPRHSARFVNSCCRLYFDCKVTVKQEWELRVICFIVQLGLACGNGNDKVIIKVQSIELTYLLCSSIF